MEQKIDPPAGGIKSKVVETHAEVREKTIGYITAAFGLVAGLAWNEAIKALIDAIFPLSKNSITAKFVYAGLVTAVVIFVSMRLNSFIKKDDAATDKK